MELKGKIISFLGDSITEGCGVADIQNNRYDNRLKSMCELSEVYNYGLGGTRFAYQSKPSESPQYDLYFCGRASRLNLLSDIIVVYGGVNDYLHGDAPFGSMGDSEPTTFCGATRFLMEYIKAVYPNAKLVFMTPSHCNGDNVPSENSGKPLSAYVEIIKETGKLFEVPVLDMHENLGIDPNNQLDKETYTYDGLHFNDAGHEYIAKALEKFLREL